MEVRIPAQRQRDTRIIENLSLRRRCMFLMDRGMWRACVLGVSGDVAAASANAAELRSSTVELLKTHSRQLDQNAGPGLEDVQRAVYSMTAALVDASSLPSSESKASPVSTSTSETPQCGRSWGADEENLRWTQWEEALETLLAFLEEPHDTSLAQEPTCPRETPQIDSDAVAGRETSLEKAVRVLLCELVRHLYEAGRKYYATKRGATLFNAARGKRSHDPAVDGAQNVPRKMRVTWSVAAPIAPLLYGLYRR
ncbi:hypothetical protein JKF63_04800 [Porcisia hertigi]|uniref:Uncharacterized protein n=1 Tax=Porcisia hertigi TaxID=2761500 RepID=A0A836L9T3_9TRYP|nr:hypothetical protein JKF63_04800 [Porcisia hertigi]